jgi:Acyltransferase family
MTAISDSMAVAGVRAAPKTKARNFSIDRTRTFLTLVVLIHHSVIPYTYFGHTDPKSWIGFDMIVLATDSFFMAMFFFLSGLFVWTSLARKGPLNYLRDRLLRLGLPFAICALTLIPIAYYAIALRQTPDLSFIAFWWKTVTVGPWPSGPIWFLWVLFAFDLVASESLIETPRSDQSPVVARPRSPGPILRGPACCHCRARHSRPNLLWSRQLVRVRAVFSPTRPRAVVRDLLLFWRRHRRSKFRSRPVERRQPAGEEQLGLGDHSARAVLPHVGADLHQARNTGKPGTAAGLV